MLIETDRLLLRPLAATDAAALHEIWTEPQVRRYLWDDAIVDRETVDAVIRDSDACWRERGYGLWLILERESREAIGFVGFRASDTEPHPELLFGLIPRAWHRGLATEAASAALRHLFRETDVTEVWAETDAPNVASMRVMERLGMEKRDGYPLVRFVLHPNG